MDLNSFSAPPEFHYLRKAKAMCLLILQAVALWLRFSPFLELLGRQTGHLLPCWLFGSLSQAPHGTCTMLLSYQSGPGSDEKNCM